MEVTRANFEELLPNIESAIKGCSFLCVDGEFTGLNDGTDILPYETPSDYYDKLRKGALNYLFVQFGLSAFTYNCKTKKFSCKVYNFYVFPRPINQSAPDTRFLCQSSSIDFLASQGFDFNKLFREGISYLCRSDEEAVRQSQADRRSYIAATNASSSPVRVPPNLKNQIEQACLKIGLLLEDDAEEEEVTTEKCSAFVRKLIYKSARERFGDKVILETKEGGVTARRREGPLPTEEQLEREALLKDEGLLHQARGFSKIIDTIAQSGKLVVGHNMLLDVCHMINHFCDPLPQPYSEFKEMVHHIFPRLVDTKFMCANGPLKEEIKSSVLENLLQTIGEEPFQAPQIDCEEGYSYNGPVGKFHEAGYDAYITGVCFIALLAYLRKQDGKESTECSCGEVDERGGGDGAEVEGGGEWKCKGKKSNRRRGKGGGLKKAAVDSFHDPAHCPTLHPYINKLFLMRTPDTFISLNGDDPVPCRNHVFFVRMPNTWTNQSLIQLFSPYGSIQIGWLDSKSGWVALHDKKEAARATANLASPTSTLPPGVQVETYDSYYRKRKGGEGRVEKRASDGSLALPQPTNTLKRRKTSIDGSEVKRKAGSEGRGGGGDGDGVEESCLAKLEKEASSLLKAKSAFLVDDNWG